MKNNDQFLTSYKKRMIVSSIVSSVLLGLIVGGLAAFVASFFCWLFSFEGVWLAVGIGIGAAVLGGFLFYFLKFRPSDHEVIRRIDSMGLEERTITMMELKGDESPIAQLQRADAQKHIQSVQAESVKSAFPAFALHKSVSILLAISLVAGAGMTVVSGLAQLGILPSPDINDPVRDSLLAVDYLVEEGGEIEGPMNQLVSPGENAEPVIAVAEDGWIFVRWSDGSKSMEREDRNITADLSVTAIFEEIGEADGDGDGDIVDNDQEGDYDQNAPDANENEGAGTGGDAGDGGEGDGDGSQGEGSGTGQGGQEGEGNGEGQGDGAGGGWADNNQIIDGNTDYRDVYDIYYDMAMEIINNGGELPPYLKDFIEGYFGSI